MILVLKFFSISVHADTITLRSSLSSLFLTPCLIHFRRPAQPLLQRSGDQSLSSLVMGWDQIWWNLSRKSSEVQLSLLTLKNYTWGWKTTLNIFCENQSENHFSKMLQYSWLGFCSLSQAETARLIEQIDCIRCKVCLWSCKKPQCFIDIRRVVWQMGNVSVDIIQFLFYCAVYL